MSKAPADFDAILATQLDSVEKPKPIPQGKYHLQVKSFKYLTSKDKGTPGAEILFRIVRPIETEDDEKALAMDLSAKELRTTFWLSTDAQYRAKEFLGVHLGIHTSGRSLGEVFEDCPNMECGALISHTPKKDDPETIYANIQSTFAL